MKLYIVDAFTDQLFKGNPAGVCIVDKWLPDELMQQIAFENNQAETTFCVKEGEQYHIRWFTPSTEVSLCGHATLAAAHVLFREMGLKTDIISFTSLSGILTVTRLENYLTLDFPVDTVSTVEISEDLLACFSIPPVAAFKGKTDYMVVFHSQQDVENIQVDMNAISRLDARGLIITARGTDVDFVSRFFAPQSGIDEDPVTGSAHTTLMPYWTSVLGKQKCTAKQLSKRGGCLVCEMGGDRVKISGNAVTYLVGDIKFSNDMSTLNYLKSALRQFEYYKHLGGKAMEQAEDEHLFWQANEDSNSIAVIVKHLWGNMLSRWTDFLTTDGEKEWRKRDAEFENDWTTRQQVLAAWEEGWQCLFNAIDSITDADLEKIIYIRNEGHTVLEAFNRQIAHYSYHVGQIVYIAKIVKGNNWQSLSIPRNKSKDYNTGKFAQDKVIRHFTDDLLNKDNK